MNGRPLEFLRPRLAALLFAVPFLLHLASDDATWLSKLLSLLLLGLSLLRPLWGLTALAALLPVAPLVTSAPDRFDDVANALVLPVLVGGFLRVDDRTPAVRWPALPIFGLLVVISAGVPTNDTAVMWLSALALAALAARLVRRPDRSAVRPTFAPHGERIVHALVMSAGFAAIASAVAFWQFVRHSPAETSALSALSALLTVRLAPHFNDVNAAGSYFALFSVAALCLCFVSPRKWWWTIAAAMLLFALWLTGSRAALASVVAVAALVWGTARSRRRLALVTVSVLAIAAVGYFTFATPTRLPQAPAGYAVRVRVEMMKVGLQMAAAHPLTGVGIGEFQAASRPWITPSLVALFPPAGSGENAHNNFVQILAEVGVPGLVAFCWLLAGPAALYWRGLRKSNLGPASGALGAGLLAFLLTSLVGHPLLSTQILIAFFFSLGLLRGLAGREEIH